MEESAVKTHERRENIKKAYHLGYPNSSPTDTSPRTHPRQTVAQWTLNRRTVIRPDSNPTGQLPNWIVTLPNSNLTGQQPTDRSPIDISPTRHTPNRKVARKDINSNEY